MFLRCGGMGEQTNIIFGSHFRLHHDLLLTLMLVLKISRQEIRAMFIFFHLFCDDFSRSFFIPVALVAMVPTELAKILFFVE